MDKAENDDEELTKRAAGYIADLRSEYKYVREEASVLLAQIGPDPILGQVLKVHRWDMEGHRGTWRSRSVFLPLAIGVAGYLVFSSLANCDKDPYGSAPAFLFGALCTVIAGFIFAFLKPSLAAEYRRQSLLRLLCTSEDPRTVGTLCDYLRSPALSKRDMGLERRVRDALTRLLPKVRGATTDTLSSQQRAALRWELRRITRTGYSNETDTSEVTDTLLAIAILECVESLGDTEAIPDVDRLHRRHAGSTDQHGLAEQASQCLTVLRELHEAEKQGKALLRSSENPGAAEELLRQANSHEADPAELLRPDEEPESRR